MPGGKEDRIAVTFGVRGPHGSSGCSGGRRAKRRRFGAGAVQTTYWVDVCMGCLTPDGTTVLDCWDRRAWNHSDGLTFAAAIEAAERAMNAYAANPEAVLVAVYSGGGDEEVAWIRCGNDWRRA